jgi:hypothetical protein
MLVDTENPIWDCPACGASIRMRFSGSLETGLVCSLIHPGPACALVEQFLVRWAQTASFRARYECR